jgi:hypothetical protein
MNSINNLSTTDWVSTRTSQAFHGFWLLLFFIISRLLVIAVFHNFTASGYCCSSSFHGFWLLLFFIISRFPVIVVLHHFTASGYCCSSSFHGDEEQQ